ncbi:thioredoxin-like protein [Klebsiella michiganensis]|nr:thioredoxin-like protein [Klebsiella michiganensis]
MVHGWAGTHPVKEVVNPAFINLESRNGLGWLEGFNEMMVRCGYEWTGHPVTADGQIYTLHGKVGNTPLRRWKWKSRTPRRMKFAFAGW